MTTRWKLPDFSLNRKTGRTHGSSGLLLGIWQGSLRSIFYSENPSIEPRCPMKTITVPTLSRTTPPEPMLEHTIRLRAHELYARRGMAEGHAVDDQLVAESELSTI